MGPIAIMPFTIKTATQADVRIIFDLIEQLAEYEKLAHMVSGTEAMLHENLFGQHRACEAVIGWVTTESNISAVDHADERAAERATERAVGLALYFTTFSTFLCKPGLYLEDLFVVPEARGKGYGKALLKHLAHLAQTRGCGRFEWRVLDWNTPSVSFYQSLGATIMPEWHLVRMTEPEIAVLAADR
jgi:GNAT superfamily N-acetyltransferase